MAALVDALLEHLPDTFLEPTVDLRTITTRVNGIVAAAADDPMPALTPTDAMDGYYEDYPIRPGAEVCQFYAQCGYCKCAPAAQTLPLLPLLLLLLLIPNVPLRVFPLLHATVCSTRGRTGLGVRIDW